MTTQNKPREFWINVDDAWTFLAYASKRHAESNRDSDKEKTIHVREVLPNEASEIATLKQRLAEAEEVLKSIACFGVIGQDSPEYWKQLHIDSCASVLAKDTRIAREYFKRKEGGGE